MYDARLRRALIFLLAPLAALAQQPQQTKTAPGGPAEQAVIRAAAHEVLLDIVVRDKKGKLVRDLRPEEIEVTDDGVRQKLASFRVVTPTEAAGLGSAAAPAATRPRDPMRHVRLVSLVYEGLDNEARRLVSRASLGLLDAGLQPNVYIAVFVIAERLHVLQPFTNNVGLLRKAIERATTSNYPQFVAEAQQVRQQLEGAQSATVAAEQAAEVGLPGQGRSDSSGIAAASAAARFAQMTLNMLQFEEILTRSQQSRSSLFGILSLVKEQGTLPGRKTIVYFTRGIEVPENMVEQFQSTISEANRAGVSFYGVDARGLSLQAQNATSASMLSSAAQASQRQQTVLGAPVTPDQVRIFDTALSSIHANTQEALATLSSSTGGFLVANTNDLRGPLQQIYEDMLAYYEVSYVPQIAEFDGKFHKLAVKVTRPEVTVQSRSGYFALPPHQTSVFAYEVPLLRAFGATALPREIPFQTGVLKFGQRDGKLRYSIVVEVPLKELAAPEQSTAGRRRTHMSLVVLLKDERGAIVERFSRDFPFEVLADKLVEFQKRSFLQTYEVDLRPGRYTLEAAIGDRMASKVSARRVSLMVVPPAAGVRMSAIALVRRLDPQSGTAAAVDPFHYDGKRVVPTLDTNQRLATGGGLSFYFVIYGSGRDKPQLVLELSRDGSAIGIVRPPLPEPNERGEIPYIASFPGEALQPGQYALRAVVQGGGSATQERIVFTIEP